MFPTAKEVHDAFVAARGFEPREGTIETFLKNQGNMRLMNEKNIDTARKVADYIYTVIYQNGGSGIYC
jgi:hypothetical protein